jgi:hypothetical protein
MATAIMKLFNYAKSTHIQENPNSFSSCGMVNGRFYHSRVTIKVAETTHTQTHTQQETMKKPDQLGRREEREQVPIPEGKGTGTYTDLKTEKVRKNIF